MTGYNEAFIISTEKRDEILANCNSEKERTCTAEIIRPILRGRDIKKYSYDWAGLWLIATFPAKHYDIEQYPALKEYLLSIGKEKLEQTGKTHKVGSVEIKSRKKTNNKWFETQDSIAYWDDFNKPKICWASVGDTSYSLVPEKYLLLDTNYFFSTDNPSELLAILNSKLITWWIKSEDTQLGSGGAWRHYKYNLEKLHVPKTDNLFHDLIENIIINHKLSDSMYKINHIVYELYHLTDEEIMYIEDRER